MIQLEDIVKILKSNHKLSYEEAKGQAEKAGIPLETFEKAWSRANRNLDDKFALLGLSTLLLLLLIFFISSRFFQTPFDFLGFAEFINNPLGYGLILIVPAFLLSPLLVLLLLVFDLSHIFFNPTHDSAIGILMYLGIALASPFLHVGSYVCIGRVLRFPIGKRKKILKLILSIFIFFLINTCFQVGFAKDKILSHLVDKYNPGTCFGMPSPNFGNAPRKEQMIAMKNILFIYFFSFRDGNCCEITDKRGLSVAGLVDFVFSEKSTRVPC